MKPAPKVTTIPCWNCNGVMTFYGHAGLYDFYRCQQCGVEKAEYEPQTEDRDCNPTRPEPRRPSSAPPIGDRGGRIDAKEAGR